MKAYIISIAAASVISAVVTILTPKGWTKYVGIVTGLVVVMCIGQPLLQLMRTDVFEDFKYETERTSENGSQMLMEEIKKELTERIEEDAEQRLKNEFGAECEVSAVVSVDSAGKISGIEEMTVIGGNIDNAAIGRLRDIYGVKKVNYGGAEKITSKQE
ncbi:MAG: stage III sporulation protein AF [Candidatus Ornithomonoglobus sp.]